MSDAPHLSPEVKLLIHAVMSGHVERLSPELRKAVYQFRMGDWPQGAQEEEMYGKVQEAMKQYPATPETLFPVIRFHMTPTAEQAFLAHFSDRSEAVVAETATGSVFLRGEHAQQFLAVQLARDLLRRHQAGDWGDVDSEDKAANDRAVRDGLRLLSAYDLGDGLRVWLITEHDRSVTTLLLPSDY